MLRKNPLQPPRPFAAAAVAVGDCQPGRPASFLTAEDFDSTGIMAGVDLSESLYWWLPELYGPEGRPAEGEPLDSAGFAQATSRARSQAVAAA
jgi:hypothetical protein